MSLSLDDITRIVANFLGEHGRTLELVGVTATDGGSGRAELLITVSGCHEAPCRLLVNVTRENLPEFERELRAKLAGALESHRS